MAHAAQRLGHRVNGKGAIRYSERRISWARADKIAGRRLDRRKNYMVINGKVCSTVSWTTRCSGCSDEFCDDRGAGCHECGYSGKVRQGYWMPDDGTEPS